MTPAPLRNIVTAALLVAVASGLLAGCATKSGPPPKPKPVKRMIRTDPLNPITVTLAWNGNPDPSIGYRVYQGAQAGLYTNVLDAGTNLTGTFSNLTRLSTFYFAATAYNTNGLESVYSDPLAWSPPAAATNLLLTLRVLGATNAAGPWQLLDWPGWFLTNPAGDSQFYQLTITKTNF